MLEKKIKYKLTQEDINILVKQFPKGTTFVFLDDDDIYKMDYQIIQSLKKSFSMDNIVRKAYNIEDYTFEKFLSDRKIPYYLIYEYVSGGVEESMDIYRVPFEIDFKSHLRLTLQKKTLPKIKGVPTKAEYYESMYLSETGQATYNKKICETVFDLRYTDIGFIYYKSVKLRWCLSCGTVDQGEKHVKEIGHGFFDPVLDGGKIIKEGTERRTNIYLDLQTPAIGMLQQAYPDKSGDEIIDKGREFMSFYKDHFERFINESQRITDKDSPDFGKREIVVAIRDDKEANHIWLDSVVNLGYGQTTPRQYFMEQFTL